MFETPSFQLLVTAYFIGEKGGSCQSGEMITDKQECKMACDHLNIDHGTMKNGNTCYRAKNGKCRQDGKYKIGRSKTEPLCKNAGNFRSKIMLIYYII